MVGGVIQHQLKYNQHLLCRENFFGGHFLGSCVCNHTFTIILFLWQEITKSWKTNSLNWMVETTKPIFTGKELFKVYLSPRRQKGYCCFSLLRDFRAGPLTHSPCQGGINDPKQLPLGIPTHPPKHICYVYDIAYFIFLYKYINIIAMRKTCQIISFQEP